MFYTSSGAYTTFRSYTKFSSSWRNDESTGVTNNVILSNYSAVASTFNSATQFNYDINVTGNITNTNLSNTINNYYDKLSLNISTIISNINTISSNINTISSKITTISVNVNLFNNRLNSPSAYMVFNTATIATQAIVNGNTIYIGSCTSNIYIKDNLYDNGGLVYRIANA